MADRDETRVVVTDVRIPFWSMVALLVKLTIAAIPAYLILITIGVLVFAFFGVLGAGVSPN